MEPSAVLWVPESWPQRANPAQCPFSRYQMYAICFLLSLPVVYQAFQKILEPKRTSVNIWSNCLAHGEMEVKKGQMLGSKVKIKKIKERREKRPANSQVLLLVHSSCEVKFGCHNNLSTALEAEQTSV